MCITDSFNNSFYFLRILHMQNIGFEHLPGLPKRSQSQYWRQRSQDNQSEPVPKEKKKLTP